MNESIQRDTGVRLTDVRFQAATAADAESGLLGWVSCTSGALRLDGISVRRTLDGRLTLSFPLRRDSFDREHYYFRPVDSVARREIERQVFSALGLDEEL